MVAQLGLFQSPIIVGPKGIIKNCLICQREFTDYSRNHNKDTCSRKCRREYYYGRDGDKYFKHMVDMRFNILRLKGVRLSQEERDLIIEQLEAGKCEICGNMYNWQDLVIDHDHETNKIRGVVCQNCNHLLGFANDNQTVLDRASEYLQKHK